MATTTRRSNSVLIKELFGNEYDVKDTDELGDSDGLMEAIIKSNNTYKLTAMTPNGIKKWFDTNKYDTSGKEDVVENTFKIKLIIFNRKGDGLRFDCGVFLRNFYKPRINFNKYVILEYDELFQKYFLITYNDGKKECINFITGLEPFITIEQNQPCAILPDHVKNEVSSCLYAHVSLLNSNLKTNIDEKQKKEIEKQINKVMSALNFMLTPEELNTKFPPSKRELEDTKRDDAKIKKLEDKQYKADPTHLETRMPGFRATLVSKDKIKNENGHNLCNAVLDEDLINQLDLLKLNAKSGTISKARLDKNLYYSMNPEIAEPTIGQQMQNAIRKQQSDQQQSDQSQSDQPVMIATMKMVQPSALAEQKQPEQTNPEQKQPAPMIATMVMVQPTQPPKVIPIKPLTPVEQVQQEENKRVIDYIKTKIEDVKTMINNRKLRKIVVDGPVAENSNGNEVNRNQINGTELNGNEVNRNDADELTKVTEKLNEGLKIFVDALENPNAEVKYCDGDKESICIGDIKLELNNEEKASEVSAPSETSEAKMNEQKEIVSEKHLMLDALKELRDFVTISNPGFKNIIDGVINKGDNDFDNLSLGTINTYVDLLTRKADEKIKQLDEELKQKAEITAVAENTSEILAKDNHLDDKLEELTTLHETVEPEHKVLVQNEIDDVNMKIGQEQKEAERLDSQVQTIDSNPNPLTVLDKAEVKKEVNEAKETLIPDANTDANTDAKALEAAKEDENTAEMPEKYPNDVVALKNAYAMENKLDERIKQDAVAEVAKKERYAAVEKEIKITEQVLEAPEAPEVPQRPKYKDMFAEPANDVAKEIKVVKKFNAIAELKKQEAAAKLKAEQEASEKALAEQEASAKLKAEKEAIRKEKFEKAKTATLERVTALRKKEEESTAVIKQKEEETNVAKEKLEEESARERDESGAEREEASIKQKEEREPRRPDAASKAASKRKAELEKEKAEYELKLENAELEKAELEKAKPALETEIMTLKDAIKKMDFKTESEKIKNISTTKQDKEDKLAVILTRLEDLISEIQNLEKWKNESVLKLAALEYKITDPVNRGGKKTKKNSSKLKKGGKKSRKSGKKTKRKTQKKKRHN